MFLLSCSDDAIEDSAQVESQIALSAEVLEFASDGQSVVSNSVVVASSANWRLSGKKTWCVPSSVAGADKATVEFQVEPNSSAEERQLTYTFICNDKIQDVVIKQAAAIILDIAPDAPATSLLASSAGEMVSIKLVGNIGFTHAIEYASGEDWVRPIATRAVSTSYLYFDIVPNTSYEERTATVVITPEIGEPLRVKVIQSLNPAIIPEQDVYELTAEGGNIEVNVRSNVAYDVVISTDDAKWITRTQTRGLTGSTLNFAISPTRSKRTGSINLVAKDGSGVVTPITIKQEGQAAIYTNIVDPILRSNLIAWGYVTLVEGTKCEMTENGLTAEYMSCGSSWSYTNISSMEGLGTFEAMTSLSLNKCNISVCDISTLHNVSRLDLGNNPLSVIKLGDNNITEIDTWASQKLYNYSTYEYASNLTVAGEKLNNLYLNGEKFSVLDVVDCPNLKELDCGGCTYLTTVRVKRNNTIKFYNVDNSKIVYVD